MKQETLEARKAVAGLLAGGVYDQNKIFNILYPTWNRHYSTLRELIADVKDKA